MSYFLNRSYNCKTNASLLLFELGFLLNVTRGDFNRGICMRSFTIQ
jgi:hypothetical protein